MSITRKRTKDRSIDQIIFQTTWNQIFTWQKTAIVTFNRIIQTVHRWILVFVYVVQFLEENFTNQDWVNIFRNITIGIECRNSQSRKLSRTCWSSRNILPQFIKRINPQCLGKWTRSFFSNFLLEKWKIHIKKQIKFLNPGFEYFSGDKVSQFVENDKQR